MITLAQLKQFLPANKYLTYWHAAICAPQEEFGGSSLLEEYDINTPQRIASFMAQCAHESGNFVFLSENLNYKAAGLMRTFPKYFPDMETAQRYEKKPQAIANRVYANRMGNGDEASGDGWRYRGKGLIQLTGKTNHQAFASSLEMRLEDVGDFLETFEGAAQSACWFWETNRLNQFADTGSIREMTRRINGGFIGLEDRIKHYNHALHVLGAA